MSWDVMLFAFGGETPPPVEAMGGDFKPSHSLGRADDLRKTISTHLPDVDWSDPEWGMLGGDGYSIEFNLADGEIIEHMMLHVRGGGDPVSAIAKLCKAAGWSALDTSTGRWLDVDSPSREGWEGFQRFRDKVVAGPSPPTDCPECKRKLSRGQGRCPFCGWSAETGLKPSAQPHPWAPGRPPEPDLGEALETYGRWKLAAIPIAVIVTVIVVWLWPRGAQESRVHAMKILVQTQSYLKKTNYVAMLPDGRVEAGPAWTDADTVVTMPDGKRCVCDLWKHPIHAMRSGGALRMWSLGPNGVDDQGKDDDIVIELPE